MCGCFSGTSPSEEVSSLNGVGVNTKRVTITNSLCSLTLRHKAILLFALTAHSCSVSMCVKRSGRTDATGLWKSKPISVSESWGVALCIQTCFNQADTLWHRQGLVHNEGQGLDTLWQDWTATRGTDRLYPCICIHSASCDAMLGQWGGNSANVAVWWPSGWPGIGHVDIPSLSNKITAAKQLTLSNGDDWTRSWLTAGPLAGWDKDVDILETGPQKVYSIASRLSRPLFRF